MNIIQSSFILELLKIMIKNLSNKNKNRKKTFFGLWNILLFSKKIPNILNFKIDVNSCLVVDLDHHLNDLWSLSKMSKKSVKSTMLMASGS